MVAEETEGPGAPRGECGVYKALMKAQHGLEQGGQEIKQKK